jgi:hypothetical protein
MKRLQDQNRSLPIPMALPSSLLHRHRRSVFTCLARYSQIAHPLFLTGVAACADLGVARMQTDEGANAMDLATILPCRINFGVVATGFIYQLKFSVQNNSTTPMRMRVTVTPLDDEPNAIKLVTPPEIVAPGLAAALTLELEAEYPASARYLITVAQNHSSAIYTKEVEANIVSTETFKHVKKSLTLQNRPIHQPNVIVIGNIPYYDTFTEVTQSLSAATSSELALMDDDEIEDLFFLPMALNTYWDPFDKCLRVDPQLGQVQISIQSGLEEAKAITASARETRLQELEDQGFFTVASIARMREGRTTNASSTIELFGLDRAAAHVHESDRDVDSIDLYTKNTVTFHDEAVIPGIATLSKANSGSTNHMTSVSSLLALKRERLDLQRQQTLSNSENFRLSSKNDQKVDARRTLQMIRGRSQSSAAIIGMSQLTPSPEDED